MLLCAHRTFDRRKGQAQVFIHHSCASGEARQPANPGAGPTCRDHLPNLAGVCTARSLGRRDFRTLGAECRSYRPHSLQVGLLFRQSSLNIFALKLSEVGFEQAAVARDVISICAQTSRCDVQHDRSSAVANRTDWALWSYAGL